MSDTWKDWERWLADFLGGERLGMTGKQDPDVITPRFSIEAKCAKAVPKVIYDFMEQAHRNAHEGTTPICAWHRKGRLREHAIVGIRLPIFKSYLQNATLLLPARLLPDYDGWTVSEEDTSNPWLMLADLMERVYYDMKQSKARRLGKGEDAEALLAISKEIRRQVTEVPEAGRGAESKS